MSNTSASLRKVFQQKGFQAALILLFNSFSWYFPLFILFSNELVALQLGSVQLIMIFGFHYVAIVGSAFIGNQLVEKIGRNRLLSIWIFLGVCATALLFSLSFSNVIVICAISAMLGLSLGLGFPTCLAYFGDNSANERKGIIGGIAFAITFVAIALAGFLTTFENMTMTDFTMSIIGFSLWRFVGLLFFLRLKTQENATNAKVSYLTIVRERTFLLYFVPWTIFCVINFFAAPFFDTQLQLQYTNANLSNTNLISLAVEMK